MPKPWRAVCPLLNTAKPIQEKRGANLAGRCCAFAAQTSAEFPLSFSCCGLEGKAEVQAACHSSCTTDLYTCSSPPCVPKCTGRKFSTSLRQCQVEIQMIIPKGTCLQRLPRCNSVVAPAQAAAWGCPDLSPFVVPVLGMCSLGIPKKSAKHAPFASRQHGAPCSLIWGGQLKSFNLSLVSCLQQLVARPQLRHGLPLPALPMHTRRGRGGTCSTLLPQPLRFYSFKVSPRTKQSLRIIQE